MVPSGPSLAQRMLAAAQTLEDFAAAEGLELPDRQPYSAWELRRQVNWWANA
jgi:hypothetical protein